MKRALIAAAAFFLALFTLGFVLGTIRVVFVAPRYGQFEATAAEVPVMLIAAFFICRWSIRRWQVPRVGAVRWAMVLAFLALLVVFETLLGATLFGRTAADQWAALATPAGLLGLSAQVAASLLPVILGRRERV